MRRTASDWAAVSSRSNNDTVAESRSPFSSAEFFSTVSLEMPECASAFAIRASKAAASATLSAAAPAGFAFHPIPISPTYRTAVHPAIAVQAIAISEAPAEAAIVPAMAARQAIFIALFDVPATRSDCFAATFAARAVSSAQDFAKADQAE